MHISATLSFAVLTALGASAQDALALVPRHWLQVRHDNSVTHLGDDGVLRRMEIDIPTISRRDDHLRAARWEVRDAIPLNSQDIRRWIDAVGPSHSEHSRRHFEKVYAGIDGRDVRPEDIMNPHPNIRLASPGSVMVARDMFINQRMDEESRSLAKRSGCRRDADCDQARGRTCLITDRHKVGVCVGGDGGPPPARPNTPV